MEQINETADGSIPDRKCMAKSITAKNSIHESTMLTSILTNVAKSKRRLVRLRNC